MPFLKRVKSPGQGSLEYLLLIGGAILVVVVVIVLLTTTVIPAGGQFLQNSLTNVPNTVPGGNSGNNPPVPPTYSGPLLMNWSNVNEWAYASFSIDNQLVPFTADPPKILSNILLSNEGSTPVTITHVRPFFELNHSSSSLVFMPPSRIASLDVFLDDGSNTFLFSLVNLASDTPYALPPGLQIDPAVDWRIVARFDEPILPVEQLFYIRPAEHAFSFSLAWTDSSGAVHRPAAWHSALVYEKGYVLGSLDSRIAACDGDASVGSTLNSTVSVITDWCVPSPPAGCSFARDLGYSTVFSLASPLPPGVTLLSTRLFMSQRDTLSQGEASFDDADPYVFIKAAPSCSDSIFDAVEEDSPSYAGVVRSASPQDGDDEDNDVKWFDVGGLFSPGDAEVVLTIVGEDTPLYPSPDTTSEGMRLWQTGYSTGDATPAPFILIRYASPA